MRTYFLPLFTFLALICGCRTDDDQPLEEVGFDPDYIVDSPECTQQNGQALVIQSTRELLPYADGDELVFVDSLGTRIRFTVNEGNPTRRDISLLVQRTQSGGVVDTSYLCSGTEEIAYSITSEETGVSFRCVLQAINDFPFNPSGLESIEDRLTILMGYERTGNAPLAYREQVSRTFGELTSGLLTNPSVTILDRTFTDVKWLDPESQLSGSPRYLRYSTELGIVFFRDGDGKLWRLDNRR